MGTVGQRPLGLARSGTDEDLADLLASTETRQVLATIARLAARAAGGARVVVCTYDGDELLPQPHATSDAPTWPAPLEFVLLAEWPSAARALSTGATVYCETDAPAAQFGAHYCTPLRSRGESVGLLAVEAGPRDRRRAALSARLDELGHLGGLALGHALVYEGCRASRSLASGNGVARRLHDTVAQQLFVITSLTGTLRGSDNVPAEMREVLEQVQELCAAAIEDLRSAIHCLRDEWRGDTLETRLEKLARAVAARSEIEVDVSIAPSLADRRDGIAHIIHRICREGLANTERHARARTCSISCDVAGPRARWARVVVADDGAGFRGELGELVGTPGHFGLSFLREIVEGHRGTLQLSRSAWGGVELIALVPLEAARSAAPVRRELLAVTS